MKRNERNRLKAACARALVCMAVVLLAAACASAQKKGAQAIDIPSRVHIEAEPAPPPSPAKIKARICTVSGKLANKYCPAKTVKVEEFAKGQEPKTVCTVHHRPVTAKPQTPYVLRKKCPVGGELYPASARSCVNAAHKIKGQYPRLITVRVRKK